MSNREVMQQALHELEGIPFYRKYGVRISNAITALKAALEQPEQEPVADDKVICPACCHQFRAIPTTVQTLMLNAGFEPPFTTPPAAQWDKPSASFNNWWNGDYDDSANPFEKDSAAYWAWAGWQAVQRPWQGLTGTEKHELRYSHMTSAEFIDAIEAKLKERNT